MLIDILHSRPRESRTYFCPFEGHTSHCACSLDSTASLGLQMVGDEQCHEFGEPWQRGGGPQSSSCVGSESIWVTATDAGSGSTADGHWRHRTVAPAEVATFAKHATRFSHSGAAFEILGQESQRRSRRHVTLPPITPHPNLPLVTLVN